MKLGSTGCLAPSMHQCTLPVYLGRRGSPPSHHGGLQRRAEPHIVFSLRPSQLFLAWEVTIYLPQTLVQGITTSLLPSALDFLAYCRLLLELKVPFYIWGNQGREIVSNLPKFSVAEVFSDCDTGLQPCLATREVRPDSCWSDLWCCSND